MLYQLIIYSTLSKGYGYGTEQQTAQQSDYKVKVEELKWPVQNPGLLTGLTNALLGKCTDSHGSASKLCKKNFQED